MRDEKLTDQIARLKTYRDMETVDQDEFYMFTDVINAAEKWDDLLRKAGKVGLNESDFIKMVTPK